MIHNTILKNFKKKIISPFINDGMALLFPASGVTYAKLPY
jgi:hypothetical protein